MIIVIALEIPYDIIITTIIILGAAIQLFTLILQISLQYQVLE